MSKVIRGKFPLQNVVPSENGGIPFDVTFRVSNDKTLSIEEVENDKTAIDIKAHRFVLAAYSSVFRAMFYGPLKENREVIPVKQTTIEAVRKLVSYFYELQIDGNDMTLLEIFELVNLAERYAVTDLKQELEKLLQTFPITRENLMDTAEIAYQYSIFDAGSNALLLNCAKFLLKNITSASEIVEFTVKQHARGQAAVNQKLFSVVKSLESGKCGNCGEVSSCLKGQEVVHNKLREGLKVKKNIASSIVNDYFKSVKERKREVAVVESTIGADQVVVRFGKPPNISNITTQYVSSLNSVPTFCYNC